MTRKTRNYIGGLNRSARIAGAEAHDLKLAGEPKRELGMSDRHPPVD